MRLGKAQICGLWALGALASMLQGAQAQEAAPTPTSARAPAASPRDHSDRQAPAPDSSPGDTTTASTAPPLVCFKFTLQCFGNNSSTQATAQSSHGAAASERAAGASSSSNKDDSSTAPGSTPRPAAAPSSLNLAAPDVRTIVSPQELQEPLPTQEQQAQESESATVEVQSDPDTPNVPGGFGALWWALRHPTQAWRIFTPVE